MISLLQPNQESVQGVRKRKNEYMKNRAPQRRRLEDKRLEIVKSADVALHVAWYWAAVEDIPRRTEK
jgi:hypothetical protein